MFDQVDSKQICTSELKFSNFELNWTIKDFEFICKNIKTFESPRFPPENFKNSQWFIELEPTELNEKNNEKFNIYLKKADDIERHYKALITFFGSCKSQSFVTTSLIQSNKTVWTMPASELYSKLQKVPKDILITCQLSVFESGITKVEKPLVDDFLKCDDLVENIENFFDDQDFRDVTFTIGRKKFTAHKSMLALRSPVFASMFKSKKPEELTSAIKLADITPTVFQKVLRFIYTDKVDQLSEHSMLLYAAAKKYQLKKLQSMCVNSLHKNLGIKTVVSYLGFAEAHSLLTLKKKCLKHLNSDLIAAKDTEEFISLKQRFPHLIDEINNMPNTIETEEKVDVECNQNMNLKFR